MLLPQADAEEHHQHRELQGAEGDHEDQTRHGAAHDPADDQAIDAPLQEKRNGAAHKTQHQALDHEGHPDEGVAGPHHLHDGDFLTPAEGCQLDGILHDKHADDEQYYDQNPGDDGDDVAHGDKAAAQLQRGADVGNALHVLDGGLGFRHQGQVVQKDDIAVPEPGGRDLLEHLLVVISGDKVLHRLLPGDKLHVADVGKAAQAGGDLPGLLLAEVFVHKGENLVLGFQSVDVVVDVDGKKGEISHDQQAGHDDENAGKGHKSMGKNAFETLFDEVGRSVKLHVRNTRPFRR